MERLFEKLRVVSPTKTTVLIVASRDRQELVGTPSHTPRPSGSRGLCRLTARDPKDDHRVRLFGPARRVHGGARQASGESSRLTAGPLFSMRSRRCTDLQVKFLRSRGEEGDAGRRKRSKEVDFRAPRRDQPRPLEVEIETGAPEDLFYRPRSCRWRSLLSASGRTIPSWWSGSRSYAREHEKAVTGVTPLGARALVSLRLPSNSRAEEFLESAVLLRRPKDGPPQNLPAAVRPRARSLCQREPPEGTEGARSRRRRSSARRADIEKEDHSHGAQVYGGNPQAPARPEGSTSAPTLQRSWKSTAARRGATTDEDSAEDTARRDGIAGEARDGPRAPRSPRRRVLPASPPLRFVAYPGSRSRPAGERLGRRRDPRRHDVRWPRVQGAWSLPVSRSSGRPLLPWQRGSGRAESSARGGPSAAGSATRPSRVPLLRGLPGRPSSRVSWPTLRRCSRRSAERVPPERTVLVGRSLGPASPSNGAPLPARAPRSDLALHVLADLGGSSGLSRPSSLADRFDNLSKIGTWPAP